MRPARSVAPGLCVLGALGCSAAVDAGPHASDLGLEAGRLCTLRGPLRFRRFGRPPAGGETSGTQYAYTFTLPPEGELRLKSHDLQMRIDWTAADGQEHTYRWNDHPWVTLKARDDPMGCRSYGATLPRPDNTITLRAPCARAERSAWTVTHEGSVAVQQSPEVNPPVPFWVETAQTAPMNCRPGRPKARAKEQPDRLRDALAALAAQLVVQPNFEAPSHPMWDEAAWRTAGGNDACARDQRKPQPALIDPDVRAPGWAAARIYPPPDAPANPWLTATCASERDCLYLIPSNSAAPRCFDITCDKTCGIGFLSGGAIAHLKCRSGCCHAWAHLPAGGFYLSCRDGNAAERCADRGTYACGGCDCM